MGVDKNSYLSIIEKEIKDLKPYINNPRKNDEAVSTVEKSIKNSSKPNQTVLDLLGGSGSTLIACEQANRKCRMMELDEHYCSVIIERWEKVTGQKAKKLSGGFPELK